MFAVCQRSLFNASPAESECKGRNFLNNDQMFGRLFLKKVRSGRYRTGNTHFRNGKAGENGRRGHPEGRRNCPGACGHPGGDRKGFGGSRGILPDPARGHGEGREGALLLAALQPHIIYYMPCGMSYTSSPVAGIGFLAKKQAAWREPGGLHEFPEIPIEDLSKAHRRMGEAWGGGIESACLDCLNRSQPDADAAGGNVVLEECLPFPGAVLYSGGGNGMLPDSAMETGKTVFTDGYHRSSMRMQGIFTYNSGQPLLVTQGGLHRGCGLVFTEDKKKGQE